MKKILLLIITTLLTLLLFNTNIKAEENIELTCKYENPYGGSDIVLIGTSYTNDYIDNYNGKNGTEEMYIKSNGSSFSQIIKANQKRGHGEVYWSINKDYLMDFNSQKWLFTTNGIIEKVKSENNQYKCKDLYYFKETYVNEKYEREEVNMLSSIDHDGKCKGSTCTKLKLKTTEIYDTNKPDKKVVSSCSYGFKNFIDDKKEVNVDITFTSYNDGSLYYSLDGKSGIVDFKKDYPINTTHNVSGTLRNFMLTKDQINKMVQIDTNHNLTCSSDVAGCFGKGGIFYTFSTLEELYNSKECNDGGNVSISDSSNATIIDTSLNVKMPELSDEIGFCTSYLGNINTDGSMAQYLDVIYTLIKIVSIVITIVWSMLDMSKVIVHNKDELMATVKKIVIRIIILLVILLLPTFIDIIGDLFGVEDILCGIK